MQKQIYNVVRPREGDNGKTYWDKHGALIVKEDRISLHIDSIPTGQWDGWLHVYPREAKAEQKDRGNGSAAHVPADAPDFDDNIPFN